MRIAFGSYNHAIQQGHSLFWVNYSKYNWYVKFLVFLLYNIVGIVVYHRNEDWSILYCIYFITVGFTTVGYGHTTPTNEKMRLFTAFYLLLGCNLILHLCMEFAKVVLVSAQDEMIERYYLIRFELLPNQIPQKSFRIGRAVLSVIAILFCLLIGTLFYTANEGWTYIDGFYWTAQTITTVGYGDFIIQKQSTMVFGIFFMYGCVLTLAVAFSNILDAWVEDLVEKKGMGESQHELSTEWVEQLVASEGAGGDHSEKISGTVPVATLLLSLMSEGIITASTDVKPLVEGLLRRAGSAGGINKQAVEEFRLDIRLLQSKHGHERRHHKQQHQQRVGEAGAKVGIEAATTNPLHRQQHPQFSL